MTVLDMPSRLWHCHNMQSDYQDFLASKTLRAKHVGIEPPPLASHLYPFQRHCVEFALRADRVGLFLDTGLGKTECQLEFCQKALEASNGRALIMTPLAVAGQTKRRADRWKYPESRVVRSAYEVKSGINICNYDSLHKLDPDAFDVVAFDEASILKSFIGKTTRSLISAFKGTRFRMVATATPAPNDHTEIAGYSEFLEVLSPLEMLSRFFINDTSKASQEWRLKNHAVNEFWDWMSSWSRMASMPSDLGDKDDGFILPPYKVIRHRAKDTAVDRDLADMFGIVSMSAINMHDIKRQTSVARAEVAASIIDASPSSACIIWCDTDYEADEIMKVLPRATEIRGSMSVEQKEARALRFETGDVKHLVTKPSCCGFGLDWSHCDRMIFVGRSFSYETWYQAVRRCWRYGQKKNVEVHLILAEGENEIGRIIDRKATDHDQMKVSMRAAMARAMGKSAARRDAYDPKHIAELASWVQA